MPAPAPSRVADPSGARLALVLGLALLAPVAVLAPTPPPALEPVWIEGACRLGPAGAGTPCPCDAISGELRRALGWPIPLATATAADLEALPGIGPARARAIAEDRARRGAFVEVAALERVPGLGPATVAKLRPLLVAEADDPACPPRRGRLE